MVSHRMHIKVWFKKFLLLQSYHAINRLNAQFCGQQASRYYKRWHAKAKGKIGYFAQMAFQNHMFHKKLLQAFFKVLTCLREKMLIIPSHDTSMDLYQD